MLPRLSYGALSIGEFIGKIEQERRQNRAMHRLLVDGLQEKATATVLEQAALLSGEWAMA